MSKKDKELERILQECKKATHFQSLSFLAGWDQETYMPKDGIVPKSEILSFLAQERHQVLTGKKLEDSVKKLLKDLPKNTNDAIIVKKVHEDITKEKKLGKSFVKKWAKETSLASDAWKISHKTDNFKSFLPHLKKVIQLCQKKAELVGFKDHPYDALLDEFEPGMTTKQLDEIFDNLKPRLTSLIKKIKAKDSGVKFSPKGIFPIDLQKELAHDVIQRIGVKVDQYNLSTTFHPFCTSFHPHDIRITSNFRKDFLLDGFSSVIHEAGHGLYENNLPAKYFATPLCQPASLGIHESQSRIYETCLGNSLPFWKFYYPKFQKKFPDALEDVSIETFVAHVREVKPSLIRIFADEVTYCLHIILRYEIEKGLMDGSIAAKDIPSLWREKMQQYLGILPSSDTTGCLQDIHWSIGCFGYFPTYALGSMYAGSLFTKFIKNNVDWASKIALGDFSDLSNFLKEKIHIHGRAYLPFELIERATEKPFTPDDYIQYLEHRYLN